MAEHMSYTRFFFAKLPFRNTFFFSYGPPRFIVIHQGGPTSILIMEGGGHPIPAAYRRVGSFYRGGGTSTPVGTSGCTYVFAF